MNQIWYQDFQFWAIIVALILGLAGIFQDRIRSVFLKPKMSIDIKLEPPDCHKNSINDKETGIKICDTYYLRFRIENNGNYQMDDVEAMVIGLVKKEPNEMYKKVKKFLPLNLVWSHYRTTSMKQIQAGVFKHLDLAHIIRSEFVRVEGPFKVTTGHEIIFVLDTAVTPNNNSNILLPGTYQIDFIFVANNLKPVYKKYEFIIANEWSDEEKIMLEKNISIKEINL